MSRFYEVVPAGGGQFNRHYAIRPVGEHRMLCTNMNLTWDQADRLCDVMDAERQRNLAPIRRDRAA
jgi:Spy/CpxP family protein refolding chaperone